MTTAGDDLCWGGRHRYGRWGEALYAVAGYSTGLVLFGLTIIGWAEQYFNLKCRPMTFRITNESRG